MTALAELPVRVAEQFFSVRLSHHLLPPERADSERKKKISLLWPRDSDRIRMVLEMIRSGYISRLLLASDIAEKIDHKCYGRRGYDHILRNILPMLAAAGL